MVAVVSSKPPREGAVGSYVSSVIRFTLFRLPWGIRIEMRFLQLLNLCLFVFMDPTQSGFGEFEGLVRDGILTDVAEDSIATVGDAFLSKSSIYENVGQSLINADSGSQSSLHIQDSQPLCHEHVPASKHLDNFAQSSDVAVSRADFNRALSEARLQGVGDSELKLPWETGIMRDFFQKRMMTVQCMQFFLLNILEFQKPLQPLRMFRQLQRWQGAQYVTISTYHVIPLQSKSNLTETCLLRGMPSGIGLSASGNRFSKS